MSPADLKGYRLIDGDSLLALREVINKLTEKTKAS